MGHGGRARIRHIHEAGDASGYRRYGVRVNIRLVWETGLSKMHLVIDHTWQ